MDAREAVSKLKSQNPYLDFSAFNDMIAQQVQFLKEHQGRVIPIDAPDLKKSDSKNKTDSKKYG